MSRDEKGRNERWRHSACSWQWARLGNDGVSLSSGPGKLSPLRLRSLTTDQSELSKVEGCLVRASCHLNFTRSFLKVHFSHICKTGYSFKTTQNLPFVSWSHTDIRWLQYKPFIQELYHSTYIGIAPAFCLGWARFRIIIDKPESNSQVLAHP